MGRVKDFLIGVEELIYTALEKGITDFDGIYAYVYMYEPHASPVDVELILQEMQTMGDMQLNVC